MSSSSSCPTAASTKYIEISWIDGRNNEEGDVYIRSRRIKAWAGVHHYIAVDGIGGMWRVYEFGTKDGSIDTHEFYACEKLYGQNCVGFIGRHKLKDVYQAALACSRKEYNFNTYNCNHWTDEVVAMLGHKEIHVSWNCSCVL